MSEGSVEEIEPTIREKVRIVGGELNSSKRSGSFLQIDQRTQLVSAFRKDVEVLPILESLKKYDWMKDYYWNAVSPERDEYTREVDSEDVNGYFIRVPKGAKVEVPVEACLYLYTKGLKQKVHNVIIVEEDAELNIISGCTVHPGVEVGMHLGVSELYVKKGAKLNFTMVHSWESDIEVRPRSVTIVEEGGVFVSNYILMNPVKLVQMYPTAYLKGRGAKGIFNSVVVALEGSVVDIGSKVVLEAEDCSAEIVSRTISSGGKVIARGDIVADSPKVKGHLECMGMILSEGGRIDAIPELESAYSDVELSHEAAIGRIAEEEIFYLMTRGLSRDEATAAIIRGFLDIGIKGLPALLQKELDKAVELVGEGM
ncbi:MAG: SufB/SufD family protein [Methermicoccaceae archaeon]